jgi:glycosyltransferase involved in cell wall biosynthesis
MDPHISTDTTGPLVSFIMAAKNFEQFIGEAIASAMNQTYRNIELIVVDDASTDGTTEIIRKWALADPRVKPIFNTTSDLPPRARNRAVAQARGTYLAILDSDDISMPTRIHEQVTFMEHHPEVAAAGSHAEVIDINGNTLGIKKKSTRVADIRFAILLQNQFIHSSIIIRKSVFDEIGGYRHEYMYAEDYDLLNRILERYTVTNIDAVLVTFRASSGGVTTQSNSQKVQAESSLNVSLRNCAPYINISPLKMRRLTDMMNNKDVPLPHVISSVGAYRKLTLSYIKRNGLNGTDRANILGIYRNKVRSICIYRLKKICGI